MLDFMPDWEVIKITDHCNGLLLCATDWAGSFAVCNPATRRWAEVPSHPGSSRSPYSRFRIHLAFDPESSRHYHVISFPYPDEQYRELLPELSKSPGDEKQQRTRRLKRKRPAGRSSKDQDPDALIEWPPSLFRMHVFSSTTSRWEERGFVREGDAVVTLADARRGAPGLSISQGTPYYKGAPPWQRWAVCWSRALFVYSPGGFLTKLSLSENKYEVIKMPGEHDCVKFHIGISKEGVYYTTFDEYQLLVWALNQSSGPMEWKLKYDVDLVPLAWRMQTLENIINTPSWIMYSDSDARSDDYVDWNSDDDYILDVQQNNIGKFDSTLIFLGFHPYKEVVFLGISSSAVAWHLRDSKAQHLGSLWPNGLCFDGMQLDTYGCVSFPYAPCLIDSLPAKDK